MKSSNWILLAAIAALASGCGSSAADHSGSVSTPTAGGHVYTSASVVAAFVPGRVGAMRLTGRSKVAAMLAQMPPLTGSVRAYIGNVGATGDHGQLEIVVFATVSDARRYALAVADWIDAWGQLT
ncbi:MAG: hypothetical protein QOF08_2408, partial [Gaiellales bacterium]|nr:hypothetical protein [Gaiellales bacterium]